jgi:hypothetical protein
MGPLSGACCRLAERAFAPCLLGGLLALAAAFTLPAGDSPERRIDRIGPLLSRGSLVCASAAPAVPSPRATGAREPALASWQTVGGCGAGAASGTGAGIKWIGRNVSGGLFRLECQANYIDTDYGANYVGTTLVSSDVGERWNLGVSVPYLYKLMRDPYGLGFDVRNRGPGDVSAMVGRRFGAIADTSATLTVGLPTGTYRATLVRDKMIILPQDRQLGLGKPTAAFMLDHTVEHGWGPTVLGGTLNWRGGENELGSYRAPSASGYLYSSLLIGSFAPALGLQLSAFRGHDRDRHEAQISPLYTLAPSASLEWSADWLAVLVGASWPYQYDGVTSSGGAARSPWGFGPWMVALGIAVAP